MSRLEKHRLSATERRDVFSATTLTLEVPFTLGFKTHLWDLGGLTLPGVRRSQQEEVKERIRLTCRQAKS